MKPLVYIAGPYTKPDPITNVREATAVAEVIERIDCAVFIPHLSMLWHLISPAPIETWYARDLDVLDHCDALVRFGGESLGADAEVEHAIANGIPVFYTSSPLAEMADWRVAWTTSASSPLGTLVSPLDDRTYESRR